jgi:hypothetical protein
MTIKEINFDKKEFLLLDGALLRKRCVDGVEKARNGASREIGCFIHMKSGEQIPISEPFETVVVKMLEK